VSKNSHLFLALLLFFIQLGLGFVAIAVPVATPPDFPKVVGWISFAIALCLLGWIGANE